MGEAGSDGHRKRINAVLNSTRAKGSALLILFYFAHHSDFKTEQVIRTKGQIAEDTGLCMRTIKDALAFLRLEGTIVYVNNAKGGRGRAVTIQLKPASMPGNGRRKPTHETPAASVLREAASLIQSHDSVAGGELRKAKALSFVEGVLTLELERFGHNYLEGSASHLVRAAERAIDGLDTIKLERRKD